MTDEPKTPQEMEAAGSECSARLDRPIDFRKAFAVMEATMASFKAFAEGAARIFNTPAGKRLRKALFKIKRPSRKVRKAQKMALRKALRTA